jgi:polysaccharide chain length determinant protein (PEP-CTERM system associated)
MNYNDPIETASPVSWRHYLNIGLRFRWWLISAAVLFWAAALVASVMLPAKYKSETLVLVEPVNAHYGTPNLSADLQQRLQSLTEQTLSRPRLMQVVRDFHLYGYVSGQPVSDGVVKQMRNDISIELTKSTGGDISAFKITYSGASPEAAQKVIAALSSLFIRDSFDQQQRLTADTTSFLSSQLEEARQDMERQASLLQQFRSRNLNELPEQRAINLQILTGLQDRLRSAIDSLHQAERQKLYFGSLIGWTGNSAEASSGDAPANVPTQLDEHIEKMKADLAKLSAQYTSRHPDVVHLKDQIAEAEKEKREMDGKVSTAKTAQVSEGARAQRAISPMAEMQGQFKTAEMEIASRKQEISDLEGQIKLYQARLDQSPITEQQVVEATRNFEQARAYYDSLLAKKQQSEMATDLSRREQYAQFRTIDPPTWPQKPYWPNRLKFSLLGLFFGIALGGAGIVAKEAFDPRIQGEDDLCRWVQLPIIVTLPPLVNANEKKRQALRRRFEIVIVSLLLLAVPVLTLAVALKS